MEVIRPSTDLKGIREDYRVTDLTKCFWFADFNSFDRNLRMRCVYDGWKLVLLATLMVCSDVVWPKWVWVIVALEASLIDVKEP